jgi:hypothetical protein
MMTPREFTAWLGDPGAGVELVYHVGCLAAQRKRWRDKDGTVHQPIAGLDALAKAIARAAERGAVTLIQKRNDAGAFEYVAIKPTPPPAPPVRLASYGRRLIQLDRRAA